MQVNRRAPLRHDGRMTTLHPPAASGTTVEFAQAARLLAREARAKGLLVPGFRSPPKIVGAQRTLRRHSGGAVVAVQVRGRPWFAVAADMIEGVVAANALQPPDADRLRTDLWTALGYELPSQLTGAKVA
jgi:hypothetical protein